MRIPTKFLLSHNYRKTVRDQTFVDQTDNLFHLNF